MKRFFLLFLLSCYSCDSWADQNLPDADDLLRSCIGALPDIPLLVTGQLISKSKEGDTEKRMGVEMLLDWQANPPSARYTTRDAFGHAMEHLSVTWLARNASAADAGGNPGSAPDYRFFTGDPLQSAPLPALSAPIAGTDISWQDLSLGFLWWPGGETVGEEEVRGRPCYIIDLHGADVTMRIWIDPKIPVLLRAETYVGEECARRMDIKGFKKMNGRWVIQNVEVESYPSRHKTALIVKDVEDRTRKDFIKVDDGGAEETDNINSNSNAPDTGAATGSGSL